MTKAQASYFSVRNFLRHFNAQYVLIYDLLTGKSVVEEEPGRSKEGTEISRYRFQPIIALRRSN
jgi:hypothetical protein